MLRHKKSPEIVVQEQQAVPTTNEPTCSTITAQQTVSVNLDSKLSDLNVMAQQTSVTEPVQQTSSEIDQPVVNIPTKEVAEHKDTPTGDDKPPMDIDTQAPSEPLHIDAPDPADTSAELVGAILRNQPTIVLECTDVSTNKPHKAKDWSHILNNQPKVTLEHLKKPKDIVHTSHVQKLKKEVGTFPTSKTAQNFKFRISKFGICHKMKRKYTSKCKVTDCPKICKSVQEWNLHHKLKHPDVKYRCNIC